MGLSAVQAAGLTDNACFKKPVDPVKMYDFEWSPSKARAGYICNQVEHNSMKRKQAC
jgi:3-hydroxymyristoyl/3-hydroxydecanoyl-(acyl carrier protein) dehydratase